jgi:hypothetical protein
MPTPVPRLAPVVLAAAALAAPVLVAPGAHADPVFTYSVLGASAELFNNAAAPCTVEATVSPAGAPLPVAENGAGTGASAGASGTVTSDNDATDVVTVATSLSGVASVTSAGADPRAIDLTATGSVEASTTRATSVCRAVGYGEIVFAVDFTVSRGGFLTMTTSTSSYTRFSADMSQDVDGSRHLQISGHDQRSDGTTRLYLTPGRYSSIFVGEAYVDTSTAIPRTPVGVTVHATFAVAGSQTAASVGKGAKYVALPSSRSCATHALTASVVGKRKLAKKIKQVRVFVNDVQVAKVRKPHRGALVTLPVADGVRADVRSEITLRPKHKGRPAKVLETTASYEACA